MVKWDSGMKYILSYNQDTHPYEEFKSFYPNSDSVKEIQYLKNGKKDSISISYYENGIVSERKEWKNGFLHGYSKTYDEQGNLEENKYYLGGIIQNPILLYDGSENVKSVVYIFNNNIFCIAHLDSLRNLISHQGNYVSPDFEIVESNNSYIKILTKKIDFGKFYQLVVEKDISKGLLDWEELTDDTLVLKYDRMINGCDLITSLHTFDGELMKNDTVFFDLEGL